MIYTLLKHFITIFGFLSLVHSLCSQDVEHLSISEFNSGKVSRFSTHGLEKSKGLKLHIKYPSSWKSFEGERPHIVRKFVQPDNYAYALINIRKLDQPFTNTEKAEIFTPEGLMSIIPESGTIINTNPNLKIEKLRAGRVSYFNSEVRMDKQLRSYNETYFTIYDEYLIMIQFMVPNKLRESDENLLRRYNIIEPLFYKMFNSVVIDNIWE